MDEKLRDFIVNVVDKWEEEYCGTREGADLAAQARAWLAAQPAEWMPVPTGTYKLDRGNISVGPDGSVIAINDTGLLVRRQLPASLRLCRKEE